MKSKITAKRDLIEARTRQVSAYALSHGGQVAGRVVLTYPRDGAGVIRCVVCFSGGPLARIPALYGKAGGYGYDKASAAVRDALGAASVKASVDDYAATIFRAFDRPDEEKEFREKCASIGDFLHGKRMIWNDGNGWESLMRELGYEVHWVA